MQEKKKMTTTLKINNLNNPHCHFDRSPTAFSGRTQWRNLKLSKNSSTTSFGLALTGFARNDKKDSSEILAYAGMKNLILIVICHSCESRNPFHYGVIRTKKTLKIHYHELHKNINNNHFQNYKMIKMIIFNQFLSQNYQILS